MIDEKKTVALILAQLSPNAKAEIEIEPAEEGEDTADDQLHNVAGELIAAVHAGDAAAVAEALRAAFAVCDAEPHVEGEHLDEEPTVEEATGYAYGGKAQKRMAGGGMVRRYADGGMVAPYGPAWLRELTAPGGSSMTDQALKAALARR